MPSNINNTHKKLYRGFTANNQDLHLFQYPWWLDVVCGKENWDVGIVEKGGEIWGTFPYPLQHTIFGLRIAGPKLTQALGPWIKYPKNQKYASRLSHEKDILNHLIDQLPNYTEFKQNFHYSITNWLPFFWKGFSQTTRYTYLIPNDISEKDAWNNIDKKTRADIQKAKNSKVRIEETEDISTFFKVNKMSFERKNTKLLYSFELLKDLDQEIRNHSCGKILLAKDQENNIHAVIYLVWDKSEIYYLAGGFDPNFSSNGAMSLLVWEGIQLAISQNKIFNFEGSMIENVEKFFRGFGGEQTRYFQISKANSIVYKTRYYIKSLL